MRSILSVMIAERVLPAFILEAYESEACGERQLLLRAGQTSLQALLSSAMQECEEEQGDQAIPSSAQVLSDIHQRKTADLFIAPLAFPLELESPDPLAFANAKGALQSFALACQIMDDIQDACLDSRSGRYNLILSLLAEEKGAAAVRELQGESGPQWRAWERYPQLMNRSQGLALDFFQCSFDCMNFLGISIPTPHQATIRNLICRLLRVPEFAEID